MFASWAPCGSRAASRSRQAGSTGSPAGSLGAMLCRSSIYVYIYTFKYIYVYIYICVYIYIINYTWDSGKGFKLDIHVVLGSSKSLGTSETPAGQQLLEKGKAREPRPASFSKAPSDGFHRLGILFMGVVTKRVLLLGVIYIKVPDVWKLTSNINLSSEAFQEHLLRASGDSYVVPSWL